MTWPGWDLAYGLGSKHHWFRQLGIKTGKTIYFSPTGYVWVYQTGYTVFIQLYVTYPLDLNSQSEKAQNIEYKKKDTFLVNTPDILP